MLGAVDALARGPVAHKEMVYQDLAICDLVLQHFGSYFCSPSAGTPLGAVGTQRLGEAHGWGGSLSTYCTAGYWQSWVYVVLRLALNQNRFLTNLASAV